MCESSKVKVWIDCDPGIDDAFALILACNMPQIEILGISIVHGNDRTENCGLNAKRLLWTCGAKNIPVYLGAERPLVRDPKYCPEIHGTPGEQGVAGMCGYHFPDDLIFSNSDWRIDKGHGVLKMKEAILESPSKITLVATGAQTNVALLLRMFPEVSNKIEKIVFMGGAIGLGNSGVAAEFNIEIDPEAAHIVMHSGIPLVMVPLEVTHTILVTDSILSMIKNIDSIYQNQISSFLKNENYKVENVTSGSPFGNCCYKLLSFFKKTYKDLFSFDSPPLHDPCTIFYILKPESFETKSIFVDVEISSSKCLGSTLCDIYGFMKSRPNVTVCTSVNTLDFWEMMLNSIARASLSSRLNNL